MGVAAGDGKSAAEIIATKSAGWFGVDWRPVQISRWKLRCGRESKFTSHNAQTTGGSNEAAVAFHGITPKKRLTHIWTRRKLRRSLRFQT
jgi:hypothetical protein